MADSSDVVHNRVAMLRAERRISRRELAEALGVHYQTIGYLERGEYSPSLHLALRIAAYFDVPVEVVFSVKSFKRLGEWETELSALARSANSVGGSPSRVIDPCIALEAQLRGVPRLHTKTLRQHRPRMRAALGPAGRVPRR